QTVDIYTNQYGGPGRALYYRIPILRPLVPISTGWRGVRGEVNWASSIQAPLGANSPEILADIQKGVFTSAVGTKLTLSNWATPDMVRYAELLKAVMPKSCKHLYFTSGRDEIVDKGLRCLRVTRPEAQVVIGLKNQYVGHTTAAARSLTDPSAFTAPFGWFDWPLVNSIEEIEAEIQKHSADKIFAIVVELVGEKTGHVIAPDFLEKLEMIRSKTNIPLVFVETASGLGRNGESLFMSDTLSVQPNMVWWYSGAQLGHIFVDDTHYASKPLTLISTWDGDEISMRRNYRHILVAREALKQKTALYFDNECKKLGSTGKGFWQAFEIQHPERLADAGLLASKGFDNKVILNPPIHSTREEIDAGLVILRRCLLDAES
ncbi:MAG: aminotransferase class III-fold pyridoxal phosphate-dependent enzyme, partial [Myxococcaceae bacterium]